MEKLLLHLCCAGCGVAVARELQAEFDVSLFFYNPNIFPETEHELRLGEAKRIADDSGLELIAGEYNHAAWLSLVKGHEADSERGGRCKICCLSRLEKTACQAIGKGHDYFASTLTISPHKDASAINEIGNDLAMKHDIKFLARDFKKRDGFKRSCELSKELGLYRQDWCGCEFSKKHE